MNVTYSDGNPSINIQNIYPREEAWATKTFTVTADNTTDLEARYKLLLVVDNNEFTYPISYSLTDVNTNSNGLFNRYNNDTHVYTLKIYYKEQNADQNVDQLKGFAAHVTIDNVPTPVSFATDNWNTIAYAVSSGDMDTYNVGDTKSVNMGTYGTHTLRVANKSECTNGEESETACGFVIEYADIITIHNMNASNTNVGGWSVSGIREFLNNDIYNSLPEDLRNSIIDTTVVSGHGYTNGEENSVSTDKLYLLSAHEVYEDGKSNPVSVRDTAYNETRQLDYYANLGVTTSNYSATIKKNASTNSLWWLRTAHSYSTAYFMRVTTDGSWNTADANTARGGSPAFRIG